VVKFRSDITAREWGYEWNVEVRVSGFPFPIWMAIEFGVEPTQHKAEKAISAAAHTYKKQQDGRKISKNLRTMRSFEL